MTGALDRLQPVPMQGAMAIDALQTGAAVAKIRSQLKVSQKALASEMDITQAYLCDLEHGRRGWSLDLFNRAKQAMGRLLKA